MSLDKFKLLCWKNFTLQKRHPIAALFEIGFPILIVLLFAVARGNIGQKPHAQSNFQSFEPNRYQNCISASYESIETIGVSPASNGKLVDLVKLSVVENSGWKIKLLENAAALDSFISNENFTIGIEFSDSFAVCRQCLAINQNLLKLP